MQLPPISVTFTCVSFNILNKCNVESHMYPYCTSLDLDPDFRISKLLQWLFSVGGENANSTTFRTESSFHLKSSNNHCIQQQVSTQTSISVTFDNQDQPETIPDIICLQEIDQETFSTLLHHLKPANMDGYFKSRKSKNDGIATFFKTNKFQCLEVVEIEFDKSHNKTWHWLDRDQVAMILVLQDRLAEQILCISNTHLLFNPKRGDIKLLQLKILFDGIEQIKLKYRKNHQNVNLVLAGDFNLCPKSALYNFILDSTFSVSQLKHLDLSQMSGQLPRTSFFRRQKFLQKQRYLELQSRIQTLLQYTHDLPPQPILTHNLGKLSSAYHSSRDRNNSANGDDIVSTVHQNFCGLVDYLFFDTTRLCVKRLIAKLPLKSSKPKKLPNQTNPISDHLPLFVEFEYK